MLVFNNLLLRKEFNMPTCATEENKSDKTPLSNLILPVPDTDFRDFLDEVEELAGFAPQIIEAIEKDLDAHAREKKKLRLEDRRFFEGRTADLPELDIEEENILAAELNLAVGRPRMPAYSVYVFVMIRGFLGSLSTKPARRFVRESMSLYGFLQRRGLRMPAVTTILENVNLVSHTTRKLIFDKQIGFILQEQWDDFGKLTIDSTSVKANSCWPTDGKISGRSFEAGQSFGSEVACIRAGGFSQGMGWALAAGDGQAGVSDLSGLGQTEVQGQAEQTLPAVAQAGPQGGRLTNGGTEPS